jgi:hypothetical protein
LIIGKILSFSKRRQIYRCVSVGIAPGWIAQNNHPMRTFVVIINRFLHIHALRDGCQVLVLSISLQSKWTSIVASITIK